MAQGLERCWWWSHSNGIPINPPAQNDGTGFWTMFPCLLHMIQIYDILWCIICICIVYIVYVCSYSLQYLYTHITYFSSSACHVWCQPPSTPQVDVTFSRVPLAGLVQPLLMRSHKGCPRHKGWLVMTNPSLAYGRYMIYIWYIMIYLWLLDQLEFRADIS